jgi:hypothetical protein
VLRITVCILALVAMIGLVVQLTHRRAPPDTVAENDSVAIDRSAAPGSAEAATPSRTNESEVLANCHPHLNSNAGSVPNVDVSAVPNPVAVRLKVRFWVNGNGFVTQAFVVGAHVYSVEDREDALHYIKGLTFTVPNTAECRTRQMELIGNFIEMRGAAGDWSTVVEMRPRYSFEGGRLVQSR